MSEPQKLAEFLRTRCDKGMYGLRYLDPPEQKIIYIPWPLAPKPSEPLPPEFNLFLVSSLLPVKFKSLIISIFAWINKNILQKFILLMLLSFKNFSIILINFNEQLLERSHYFKTKLHKFKKMFTRLNIFFYHRSGRSFLSRGGEVRRARNRWPIRSTGSGTPSCGRRGWGKGGIWGGREEKYSSSPVGKFQVKNVTNIKIVVKDVLEVEYSKLFLYENCDK